MLLLVRETFTRARSTSPSIIFFDELDAIVGKRNLESSSGGGGGTSVQERVLSTLLNEMDGVEGSRGVLVVVNQAGTKIIIIINLFIGGYKQTGYDRCSTFTSR